MKYLSDYINDKQSKLMDECGAFYAFNNKQFNTNIEKLNIDSINEVTDLGGGFFVLSINAKKLIDGLDRVYKSGIEEDIKENGINRIIKRELGNHEAQITGDLDSTFESLDGYGVTIEQVREEFKSYFEECVRNDWF